MTGRTQKSIDRNISPLQTERILEILAVSAYMAYPHSWFFFCPSFSAAKPANDCPSSPKSLALVPANNQRMHKKSLEVLECIHKYFFCSHINIIPLSKNIKSNPAVLVQNLLASCQIDLHLWHSQAEVASALLPLQLVVGSILLPTQS